MVKIPQNVPSGVAMAAPPPSGPPGTRSRVELRRPAQLGSRFRAESKPLGWAGLCDAAFSINSRVLLLVYIQRLQVCYEPFFTLIPPIFNAISKTLLSNCFVILHCTEGKRNHRQFVYSLTSYELVTSKTVENIRWCVGSTAFYKEQEAFFRELIPYSKAYSDRYHVFCFICLKINMAKILFFLTI